MQIQNTNCSWKPNILQGPFYMHILTSPWKGGGGGRWLEDTFSVHRLDNGISSLPRKIVVHLSTVWTILDTRNFFIYVIHILEAPYRNRVLACHSVFL